MEYILNANKLQAVLADMEPEVRCAYMMHASIDLVCGKEYPWAKLFNGIEKEVVVKEPVDMEAFEEFWKAYPKKVSRATAIISFAKLKINKKDGSLNQVMNALAWQITSQQWVKDKGMYIPNPTTYLNQRRWEDENESPTPKLTQDNSYLDMNGIRRIRA